MKKVFLVMSLFLLYSCSDDDEGGNGDRIDIEAIVNDPNAEFIYFEDGETQYYYPDEFFINNFSNSYLEGSDQLNINMRYDKQRQYYCYINISGADIMNRQYPYTLDETSVGNFDGDVELQLLDQFNRADVAFGPDDDYNYFGGSISKQLSLTVNSLENNVIVASFEGVIETMTGKQINVENGQLRVFLN